MKRLRLIILLLAAGCYLHTATCQPVPYTAFKTLNTADGLPNRLSATWCRTAPALYGSAREADWQDMMAESLKHSGTPGDTATLTDNIISGLYLDKQERLWIFYEAGSIDVLNTLTENCFILPTMLCLLLCSIL